MIAVWQAGGAWVPLDPEYPAERLRFLMEDSGAKVLVTREGLAEGLPVPDGCRVVEVDPSSPTPLPSPSLPPGEGSTSSRGPGGDSLSPARGRGPGRGGIGSTSPPTSSTPPAPPAGPRAWWSATAARSSFLLAARRLLDLGPESRVPQTTSPSFDASVLEIFPTLLAGGTLFLLSRDTLLSGSGLADELRRLRITAMAVVPSLLTTLPEADLPDLRTVLSGAERCPPELAARWSAGRRFLNAYGPTETSVFATTFEGTGEPPQGPPIGRPIANAEAWVVDRLGRLVPPGVPGEVWLGGANLARGYLRRPDLTAERFVPHPFSARPGERLYRTGDLARRRPDGDLEFLGRIDHQVKIRGHRIECGEVEAALARHPGVREAAVVGQSADQGDPPGGARLVAFVVPQGEARPEAGELRRFVAASLPSWMVPSAWVVLDALPLSPAGKVDRRALALVDPEPERPVVSGDAGDHQPGAPRTPVEETLARIWAEVLRVGRVGVDDDFFELGGDSILSIQVVARAAEAGLQITPRQVFEHPTVAALAEVALATAGEAGAVAVEGPAPLTPIQRAFFARGEGRPPPLQHGGAAHPARAARRARPGPPGARPGGAPRPPRRPAAALRAAGRRVGAAGGTRRAGRCRW